MNASIRLLQLLSFAMLLLLVACNSGGGGSFRITGITPLTAESGRDVVFSFTATEEAAQVDWDFGGGAMPNAASGLTPTVRMGAAGEYAVTLTVLSTTGQTATFQQNYNVVGELVPPRIIGLSPAGRAGEPGDVVPFSATLEGFADTWQWEFGPGATPVSSTQTSPLVTLGALGVYVGVLEVSNAAGSDRMEFAYGVSLGSDELSVLSISGLEDAESGLPGFVFAVTTGVPTAWSWDFGTGITPSTSTEAHPHVTFGVPGTYQGQLTVHDEVGDTASLAFEYTVIILPPTIEVREPGEPLGAVGQTKSLPVTILHGPTSIDVQLTGGGVDVTTNPGRPVLRLEEGGRFTATLVASNAAGSSPPTEVEFVVQPFGTPSWISYAIPGKNSASSVQLEKLATGEFLYPLQGHAANSGQGTLSLQISINTEPTSAADWRDVPIVEGNRALPALVIGERVYVPFNPVVDAEEPFSIAWTDDVLSTTPTWTIHSLPVKNRSWQMGEWALVDDRPYTMVEKFAVRTPELLRGVVAKPSTAEDWAAYEFPEPPGNNKRFAKLINYRERLAGVWTDFDIFAIAPSPSTMLLRAQVPHPSAWSDWAESLVSEKTGVSRVVISNDALICVGQEPRDRRIIWCMETHADDPMGPQDWSFAPIDWLIVGTSNPGLSAGICDLIDLDGRLLMARGTSFSPASGHSSFHDTPGFFQLDRCALPGTQPTACWTRESAATDPYGAGAAAINLLPDGRPILLTRSYGGTRVMIFNATW